MHKREMYNLLLNHNEILTLITNPKNERKEIMGFFLKFFLHRICQTDPNLNSMRAGTMPVSAAAGTQASHTVVA